ncbi:hypothetical protein DXG01_002852 [Tephrocybe rancida]|nr:hypothetical protein DXG01_002852 [Tephrocybe rancida]
MQQVSSYAHNWWINNANPKAQLLSPKTLNKCLKHHWEVQEAEAIAVPVIISDDESEAEQCNPAITVIILDDLGDGPDPAMPVVVSDEDISGNEVNPATEAIVIIILDDNSREEEEVAMRILISDDEGNLAINVIISDDEASGDDEGLGIDVFISDEELSGDEQQCFEEHTMTVDARHSSHGKCNTGYGGKMGVHGKVST